MMNGSIGTQIDHVAPKKNSATTIITTKGPMALSTPPTAPCAMPYVPPLAMSATKPASLPPFDFEASYRALMPAQAPSEPQPSSRTGLARYSCEQPSGPAFDQEKSWINNFSDPSCRRTGDSPEPAGKQSTPLAAFDARTLPKHGHTYPCMESGSDPYRVYPQPLRSPYWSPVRSPARRFDTTPPS